MDGRKYVYETKCAHHDKLIRTKVATFSQHLLTGHIHYFSHSLAFVLVLVSVANKFVKKCNLLPLLSIIWNESIRTRMPHWTHKSPNYLFTVIGTIIALRTFNCQNFSKTKNNTKLIRPATRNRMIQFQSRMKTNGEIGLFRAVIRLSQKLFLCVFRSFWRYRINKWVNG